MNDLLNDVDSLRVCLGVVIMVLLTLLAFVLIFKQRKPNYLKAYWHTHDDFDSFRKGEGAFGERNGVEYRLTGKHWIEVRRKK